MKILFPHYRLPYPLYVSGADKSTLELASECVKRSIGVTLFYCTGNLQDKDIIQRFKMANLTFKHSKNGFTFTYKNLLIHILYPTIFLQEYYTYLQKNPRAIIIHHTNIFNEKKHHESWEKLFIPNKNHIAFLHSTDGIHQLAPFKGQFKAIFSNSLFLQHQLKHSWQKKSTVILPIPSKECISTQKHKDAVFYTFFNPVEVKGSHIMASLVKQNPQRRFMVVLGWNLNIEWKINADQHNNLLIIPPQDNVAEIYSYSKLVLMPSQCEETFGRVQFEAAMNHTPVCVSACGGLQHYFNNNGVMVNDYSNVNAWQSAINYLDNPTHYAKAVKHSKTLAQQYTFESQIDLFIKSISTI